MKGDRQVVDWLNQLLAIELTSINQYFLHARLFKHWGFSALNDASYKKSIKDMKQADALIERILLLEGLPNLQKLNRLRIGEHTADILQCDLEQVTEQLALLQEAIAYCESVRDYVTRALLHDIHKYEEAHFDWLETQQGLIGNIGIENYQQSMM